MELNNKLTKKVKVTQSGSHDWTSRLRFQFRFLQKAEKNVRAALRGGKKKKTTLSTAVSITGSRYVPQQPRSYATTAKVTHRSMSSTKLNEEINVVPEDVKKRWPARKRNIVFRSSDVAGT